MVNKKELKNFVEFSNYDVAVISLRDVPLKERRKEAGKPLFLKRYE